MPVIVISGQPGAGSSTIGKMVAEKLGLKIFSTGEKFKGKGNQTKRALSVWFTRKGQSRKFHNWLDEEQIKAARKGNVVILGKLAITLVPSADVKVWLKAPLSVRAKRTAKRDKISVKDAEAGLREREKIERKRFKEIYGFDYFKQKADFVIDTRKKPEEIVKKILTVLKK
jgi:cytidylate kinase